MILAPIKAFHVGRAEVVSRICWPDLEGDRLSLVKRVMADQTRAALRAARRQDAG